MLFWLVDDVTQPTYNPISKATYRRITNLICDASMCRFQPQDEVFIKYSGLQDWLKGDSIMAMKEILGEIGESE